MHQSNLLPIQVILHKKINTKLNFEKIEQKLKDKSKKVYFLIFKFKFLIFLANNLTKSIST